MSYGIAGATNAYRFHHATVSQLFTAQITIEHHGLFVFIRLDASDEKRIALG
jgi:hypothetical protein